MKYGVNCRIDGVLGFEVEAESLEEALKLGREKAKKMNPFAKGLEWVDGYPEVDGVYRNS